MPLRAVQFQYADESDGVDHATNQSFAFYPIPGPGFQGDSGAEENPYYVWVDQHDILGLGTNVPIATGNQSDSLHALVGGQIVELRVPYPMGFFAKASTAASTTGTPAGRAADCG